MREALSIINWLNESDPLRGWGVYAMFDGFYLTYDHPYPLPREYWRL